METETVAFPLEDGGQVLVRVAAVEPTTRAKVQDTVRLAVNPERLHFFDTKTDMAV